MKYVTTDQATESRKATGTCNHVQGSPVIHTDQTPWRTAPTRNTSYAANTLGYTVVHLCKYPGPTYLCQGGPKGMHPSRIELVVSVLVPYTAYQGKRQNKGAGPLQRAKSRLVGAYCQVPYHTQLLCARDPATMLLQACSLLSPLCCSEVLLTSCAAW
jgi:hypothetical protein